MALKWRDELLLTQTSLRTPNELRKPEEDHANFISINLGVGSKAHEVRPHAFSDAKEGCGMRDYYNMIAGVCFVKLIGCRINMSSVFNKLPGTS